MVRERDYPEQLIKNQVANRSKQEKRTGIPIVTIYHSRLKDLSSLIKRNLQYLYVDQEVKKVFTHAPFVSCRSARNLKSFLVRSKFNLLERKIHSEKCNGKSCLVCLNVAETERFESLQTKKQYKINHNLNLNDKCLVYLLLCKICGLQYVALLSIHFVITGTTISITTENLKEG